MKINLKAIAISFVLVLVFIWIGWVIYRNFFDNSEPVVEQVLNGRPLRQVLAERDSAPGTVIESDTLPEVGSVERKPNYSVISDWLEYESTDKTYSFQYPPDMVMLPKLYGSREIVLMLFGPDQPHLVKRRLEDGLQVTVKKEFKEESVPFDRWARFTLESGTNIYSEEEIQVYGFNAIRIRGENEDVFDNVYIEMSDTELLKITSITKGEDRLVSEAVFEKMIETIKINPIDLNKVNNGQ